MGFPSHLKGADLAPLGLVCTPTLWLDRFFLILALKKERTGKQSQDDYHRH